MARKRILDLSAGHRAIWFNKAHPDALYVDVRAEVHPDLVADSRQLPAEAGTDFDLIVFDPPHVNVSANADLSKRYGHHTTAEIRDILVRTAKEAHRVSRAGALMAFKWNTHDQPLERVLELLMPWWDPLFGHTVSIRTKHASTTWWVLLRRRDVPCNPPS